MLSLLPTQREFNQRIHQLFQQWRKDQFDAALIQWFLSAPLLQSALPPLPADTTRVKLCLAWTIELLRPPVDTPADPKQVRDYNILTAYYRDGQAAKAIYDPLGGTESTFRTNWCKEATTAAAALLYTHWHATAETAIGQQWQMYAQSHQLPPGVQDVLRLLAVSREPWSAAWLTNLSQHLAAQATDPQPDGSPLHTTLAATTATLQTLPVQEAIDCFIRLGWLPPAATMVEFAPALRGQLLRSLTPAESQNGHRLAARCAFLTQTPLTAVHHWQQAGEHGCVAQVLLTTGERLFAQDEDAQTGEPPAADLLATLAQLLAHTSAQAMTAAVWGRLKRLAGRVAQLQAMQSHHAPNARRAALLQSAMTEYQEALRFLADSGEKAAVHYQLAELALPLDGALADQHLRHCIDLLTTVPTGNTLVVRAYIKRAWLSIQQRPDLIAAEANLKQARLLLDNLPTRSATGWSDWYNAWGTLCFCKGEFSRGVEALAQGIDLVREQPNQVRLCMMLHNQGLEFSSQQSAEQRIALHYLQQSLAIAVRIQHLQMQMLCYKAIGGCYFHLQQYEEAIRFYERAYMLIPADSDFKVHLCYDLAEAHVMRLAPEAAITHFRQGMTLAKQMALPDLIAAYHDLAAQSPWLWIEPYKPRMAFAIRLLLTQQQIKSQEYAQAANINEKTALKDLQDWVAQKILCQIGKARATAYVLSNHDKVRG